MPPPPLQRQMVVLVVALVFAFGRGNSSCGSSSDSAPKSVVTGSVTKGSIDGGTAEVFELGTGGAVGALLASADVAIEAPKLPSDEIREVEYLPEVPEADVVALVMSHIPEEMRASSSSVR